MEIFCDVPEMNGVTMSTAQSEEKNEVFMATTYSR